ncbi:Dedicator of cytokinesis protein 6, partial [Trichinella patagoniensis]
LVVGFDLNCCAAQCAKIRIMQQRAFARRLTKLHASDVRRQVASSYPHKAESTSSSNRASLTNFPNVYDVVDPVDFEEYVSQLKASVYEHGWNVRVSFADFPPNDIELKTIPKNEAFTQRALLHANLEKLENPVKDILAAYSADYVVVLRRYENFSTGELYKKNQSERLASVKFGPTQIYEVDLDSIAPDDSVRTSCVSFVSGSEVCSAGTRRSWSSSASDLQVDCDLFIPGIIQRRPLSELDALNDTLRQKQRQSVVFSPSMLPPEEEMIELRYIPPIPAEPQAHKLIVSVLSLKLEPEFEPIFGSMWLFDADKKRRVSENFYFDNNSEEMRALLRRSTPYQDASTCCMSALFKITCPSPDLFLVIRLEKVLQPGDINDAVDPYLKEDRNKEKLTANAVEYCDRLGQYRMALAWSAVDLSKIIGSASTLERGCTSATGQNYECHVSDSDSTLSSGTLGECVSQKTMRKSASGSVSRSTPVRTSWRRSVKNNDDPLEMDSFKPLIVTVNNFFKQEEDRLTDDDLAKYLCEIRKPSSAIKRLKCIGGVMKIDVSPCLEDLENTLSPELNPLEPYNATKPPAYKEILEFPLKQIFAPNLFYRNMLFIYPKSVNFSSRSGVARNIAIKVQLIRAADPPLMAFFGKSSCPEMQNYAFTIVNYHNKSPQFYDEIKVKLPVDLSDSHHLLFTFYHVSCRQKSTSDNPESAVPVGYSWLPLVANGQLPSGDISLPVSLDALPTSYYYLSPEVNLPNIKWLDNHRHSFFIRLRPVTTVFTEDSHIDNFFTLYRQLKTNSATMSETDVHNVIRSMTKARPESLVKFLYIILNKLFNLMLFTSSGYSPFVSSVCFEMIGQLVKIISKLVDVSCDQHDRSSLLAAYIKYGRLCTTGVDGEEEASAKSTAGPGRSNYYVDQQQEESGLAHRSPSHNDLVDVIRGFEKSSSCRSTFDSAGVAHRQGSSLATAGQVGKQLHEEITMQWLASVGPSREMACANSWFFLEILSKSIAEYLAVNKRLYLPRKMRLPEHYLDELTALVSLLVGEMLGRVGKDFHQARRINCSVGFFFVDLLSLIDRTFVFGLLRLYWKSTATAVTNTPQAAADVVSLRLDLLRIVCSHEHYITLNLPQLEAPGSAPVAIFRQAALRCCSQRAPSPSPSVSSRSSAGSTAAAGTTTGGGCWSSSSAGSSSAPAAAVGAIGSAELTVDFRSRHFLVGLVLSALASTLEWNVDSSQAAAVALLANLLRAHDSDRRLDDRSTKSRAASLYFPLLGVVMDARARLHDPARANDPDPDVTMRMIATGLVPFAGSGTTAAVVGCDDHAPSADVVAADSVDADNHRARLLLTLDTTRNLLLCFCWVIKNIEASAFRQWLNELPAARIGHFIDALHVCVSCFEYKGQQRRRQRHQQRQPAKGGAVTLEQSFDDGQLSAEVNLIVLDAFEWICKTAVSSECLVSAGSGPGILGAALRLLLHMLSCNQSVLVLGQLFASQRAFVEKYPEIVFDEQVDQCSQLCLQLLRHCASAVAEVRAQAAASLYLLLRRAFESALVNFSRLKMQITVSLSSLVGGAWFSVDRLRGSLGTVLACVDQADQADTAAVQWSAFVDQAKELVENLNAILADTAKMEECQQDFEMLTDLIYRIAKGYRRSPDLRLAWLQNLTQKQLERGHHAEAAMCYVHAAALVSEWGRASGDAPHYWPKGAVAFLALSENVLEESAAWEVDAFAGSDRDWEPRLPGRQFSEAGLCGLLEQAAQLFYQASMYELMHGAFKLILPVLERRRDYRRIGLVYGRLADALSRIDDRGPNSDKRLFGTYFRVGFYGAKFADLDGLEYVYREPAITKLSEISSRLESFYADRFGAGSVEVIKDSNNVDPARLEPHKAYLQITYVEPYFDRWELRRRVTVFERNHNVSRFVYATPFTLDGRAHGELGEQYKRKTVLTTSHSLPYMKSRVLVVHKEQSVLTPVEVAIEDINKKTLELELATGQQPPDGKILQMVLQGCIGTTVNRGPLEIANVFLGEQQQVNGAAGAGAGSSTTATTANAGEPVSEVLQNRLRLSFKDFSKKCADALRENKRLIGPNQREYQKELERNYLHFTEQLTPILSSVVSQQKRCCSVTDVFVYEIVLFDLSKRRFLPQPINCPRLFPNDRQDNLLITNCPRWSLPFCNTAVGYTTVKLALVCHLLLPPLPSELTGTCFPDDYYLKKLLFNMSTTGLFAASQGLSDPAICLLASLICVVPLGFLHRAVFNGKPKRIQHLFFIITGLLLFYINYGMHTIHSLISIFVAYILCRYFKGTIDSVVIAFVFFMSYLVIGYNVMSSGKYDLSWTMPQCVLTLRLIGLIVDLYDGMQPKEKLSAYQLEARVDDSPDLLEIAAFSYFFGGCFVGPQFPLNRFRRFVDGAYNDAETGGPPKSVFPAMLRLFAGLVYGGVHLYFHPIYPTEFFLTDQFMVSISVMLFLLLILLNKMPILQNYSFLWKLVYILFWFRFVVLRYQSAWLIAESGCILVGLGYNLDEKSGEQLWDGVRNIRLGRFELSASFQSIIDSFNYNTNKWAFNYFFKRLKFLGNKMLSHLLTLLFLALWHGTYSGYFVCFLAEFVCIIAERQLVTMLNQHQQLKAKLQSSTMIYLPLWCVRKFVVLLSCAYGFLPFALLTIDKWWKVYKSVYFFGWIMYGIVWPLIVVSYWSTHDWRRSKAGNGTIPSKENAQVNKSNGSDGRNVYQNVDNAINKAKIN